jgi:D-alanyl-D-alanine-carboxypeptidase/D-alanyl-D-alanine-endopeptidase
VTKVSTATLLTGMVDDGLLALDDPVQRYLPPGVELPVRGRPITLGDLATDTAGLPRLPHGFTLRSLRHRANPYAWFDVGELHARLPATRVRRAPGGGRATRTSASACSGTYSRWARGAAMSSPFASPSAARSRSRTPTRPAGPALAPVLAGRRGRALRSTVADLLRFLRLQLGEGDPALARAAALTHAPR